MIISLDIELESPAILYMVIISFKFITIELCYSSFCKIFTVSSKYYIFYDKRMCTHLLKVLLPDRMKSGLWAKMGASQLVSL